MYVHPSRRSRAWRAALLIVCAALLAICSSPVVARYQDTGESTSLSGSYTVTIAPEEIPAGIASGAALTGRWTLTFGDDGAFTLARADVGEVAAGMFEAGPATLAFASWDGMVGCQLVENGDATATYAWRQSDDRLALTPIEDGCPERLTLLTTRDFGSLAVCDAPRSAPMDPFAIAGQQGTPAAGPAAGQGVAAQEGYGEGAEVEEAVDALIEQANGCWAATDVDRFMSLHGQGIVAQIGMMGPPEQFSSELQTFMEAPLRLERIGPVTLDDASHAWAYVEVDLDGQTNARRMTFILQDGIWLFDTFFLFGPPLPGGPGMPAL